MQSGDVLKFDYPSNVYNIPYREALPSGNGETGILAEGFLKNEKILINNGRLWHKGAVCELPDVSYTLEQCRKLMDSGDYVKANNLLCDELLSKGYYASLQYPLPLAEITVNHNIDIPFSKYRRQLNMATGEITVSCNYDGLLYSRSCFVSRADDIAVLKIDSQIYHDTNITLGFFDSHTDAARRKYESIKKSLFTQINDRSIKFLAENDDGKYYGAVLKTVDDKADCKAKEGSIQVKNTKSITFIIKTFTGYISKENLLKDMDAVKAPCNDYDELLLRHCRVHTNLYNRSKLDLKDDKSECTNEELLRMAYKNQAPLQLINKLWNFGRYLFISGSGEGKLPFPLLGLWHNDYELFWSQNMANINLQMIYWQAPVTGLTETFLRMGIDELSVSPPFVLKLRDTVRNTDLRK